MYQISEKTARGIVKDMASHYAFTLNNSIFDATDLCEEGMQNDLGLDFLRDNEDLKELYKAEFSRVMHLLELSIPKKLQKLLK